jgi:hypothetical protein
MKQLRLLFLLVPFFGQVVATHASEATAPRGTTLSIYDSGFALVSELRSLTLAGAEERVLFKNLPARLDPQSLSVEPVAGGKGFDVLEQRFEDDLASPERLLQRYQNRPVQVRAADGVRQGRLSGGWTDSTPAASLQLIQPDGGLLAFPPLGLHQ